jgi:streptogramin lyase
VALLVAVVAIWTGLTLRPTPQPTLAPITRFRAGPAPVSVAVTPGAAWVLDGGNTNTISRFDASTGKVTATVHARLPERRVGNIRFATIGEGRLWVVSEIATLDSSDTAISAIDPTTGETVTTFEVGEGHPHPGRAGGLWLLTADARVLRLDRRTGRVVSLVPGSFTATDLAVGPEGVWVYDQRQGAVLRIDPGTNRVARTIPVIERPQIELHPPRVLALGNGAVWVVDKGAGTVVRVDPYR